MYSFRKPQTVVLVLAIVLLASSSVFGQGALQEFSKGKIFLRSGMVVEGENLKIFAEATTIEINGGLQQFALGDVTQIMAKQGKNKKFAKRCAGSCVGISLASFLAGGGKTTDGEGNVVDVDPGTYAFSLALWAGVSYGIGYFIGNVSDDWEVVYFKP